VTDRRSLGKLQTEEQREILLRKIGTAAEAGVDLIQVREKDLSSKEYSSLTREALQLAAKFSANRTATTRVIVNDRVDVALAEGAGGVHLGENSLPLAEAGRIVESRGGRRDFLIGVSCHALEEARTAVIGGADYLFFGPIFATPSKAAFGAPQGLERLGEICRAVSIPVLAIGGITLANAAECLAAGASGIVAIRLFQDAGELSSLVQALRKLKS